MIGIAMPSGESSLWSGALKPTDFSYDKSPPVSTGTKGRLGCWKGKVDSPYSAPFTNGTNYSGLVIRSEFFGWQTCCEGRTLPGSSTKVISCHHDRA